MDDPTSAAAPTSVLFVCLGNICRSPMAEGVFRHLVEQRGLTESFHIDSAGTGAWHVGEPPDARAREAAAVHGVRLGGKARQVERADLDRFDWVVAMDRENLTALEELGRGEPRATLALLRDYDREEDGHDVPDPYYGGPDGFERVYRMILRSCRELLTHLESRGPAA